MANQPTKYRKFVVGAASAALVASAVAPVASAKDFSDTKGNTHEAAIDALSDLDIIRGYEDGTFKPNKTLTRSDVVKMMGKWLLTEGYEVPSDYKTNPRFTDLTSATNDELLQMAALVKDNGVFNGDNGRLLASDNMTRENMAVVLVRAFNTVKDIDLVEYVEGQDFKQEVTDRSSAKAEARKAIDVLDFFDVTTVAQFNPKGTTTRGHFATFLNNFLNADLDQVTGVVTGVESITAINNTTVEVKFVDAVEDLATLDFKIDGLEINNKVIKQTDAKTVVLTTAAQEAAKVYTVTANDNKIGTFTGASAVVPTAIKVTTPSVQGTIGKDVTVQAEVTVPEGQSKAGIPVTFNIVNDNSNLNSKIEVVAFTNDKGVASYTYTRYYKNNDNVAAYATQKSSIVSYGKVYWAEGISITEVTEGNTLANGSKKVYKIKTDSYATQYVGTSTTVDYNYVNVAFAENVDVTPDKLVRDVDVIDTGINNGTKYPYQVTTGGKNEVRVKVNKNGEATFTLTGANASVTPIVFVDSDKSGTIVNTELQSQASTVKFDLTHSLELDVEALGTANAASITTGGDGGRLYAVTVRDKKGNLAPKGTKAYVTFETGNLSTDRTVYIDGNVAKVGQVYTIVVEENDGVAYFDVTGLKDGFVRPTVFLDGTTTTPKLDKTKLQMVGETTYFLDAVVNEAKLSVTNSSKQTVKSVAAGEKATFTYKSVDQNGFDYYDVDYAGNYEVTFQVTAHFNDVYVDGFGTVKQGETKSFTKRATAGKASIDVSGLKATNVEVHASASQVSLPNKSAELAITEYATNSVVGAYVSHTLTADASLLVVKNASGKEFTYDFNDGKLLLNGAVTSYSSFVNALNGISKISDTISVRNVDGTLEFDIRKNIVPPTAANNGLMTSAVARTANTIDVTFSEAVTVNAAGQYWFDLNKNGVVDANETATSVTGSSSTTHTFTISGATIASNSDIGKVVYTPALATANRTVKTSGNVVVSETITLEDGFTSVNIPVAPNALRISTTTNSTPGANGTKQVETLAVAAPSSLFGRGTFNVDVTSNLASFDTVSVTTVAGESPLTVATKVATALNNDAKVSEHFVATVAGTTVILTAKESAANDATLEVAVTDVDSGITNGVSTNTTAGVAGTANVANAGVSAKAGVGEVSVRLAQVSAVLGNFDKTIKVTFASADTASTTTTADKIVAALMADTTIADKFTVTNTGATIVITNKKTGAVTETVLEVK